MTIEEFNKLDEESKAVIIFDADKFQKRKMKSHNLNYSMYLIFLLRQRQASVIISKEVSILTPSILCLSGEV